MTGQTACIYCRETLPDETLACPLCHVAVHPECGAELPDTSCPTYACPGSLLPVGWNPPAGFLLLAAAAAVDGRLTEAERISLRRSAESMGLDRHEAETVLATVARGGQIPMQLPDDEAARRDLLEALASVIVADGGVAVRERRLLNQLAQLAGLPPSEGGRLLRRARLRRGAPQRGEFRPPPRPAWSRRASWSSLLAPSPSAAGRWGLIGVLAWVVLLVGFFLIMPSRQHDPLPSPTEGQHVRPTVAARATRYPRDASKAQLALRERMQAAIRITGAFDAPREGQRRPPVGGRSLSGKVLTLVSPGLQIHDLYDYLPAAMRATTPSEVGIVVWLRDETGGGITASFCDRWSGDCVYRKRFSRHREQGRTVARWRIRQALYERILDRLGGLRDD